jgi:hypothetical protein
MMFAQSSTLIRRSAPRITKSALAHSKKAFPASASACVSFDSFYAPESSTTRQFASVAAEDRGPGHVTKTLRVLDMGVVKNIMEELRSVDVNSDGR